ncbi:NAD(P)H-dependent oxidoreductase [Aestuariirhabdus sp. Z084]|uniref:NAD(P)H-dependent oxidoreductase n=1 Tax=Aestuariirhabdus haliotis TaxID=2918751 RepID=UPI00201B39A7|nr:NAD(P)H-dependent oxidoreductase [Aestuariirhabdus haliotis]MCL6417128.1 NAD(P)H-dependent oxidoreductase [Aestuariirhabdus haliotis]MCL6421078.1 NAD(P)H-dependent oxidoreductase [Aestuariirhabdus haliotis]
MTQKVLILFAHPAQDQSEVNRPMFNTAFGIDGVTCIDLYARYPNHDIDVAAEQTRLRQHDVVIFLFPFYWYSTPAILKDWMDLVLEYNFAYGKQGTALKNKVLLPVISAGGEEKAYQEDGYNHFSLRELLRPLEQTANLCRMNFIAPFVIFGSRTAVEDHRLNDHLARWQQLLEALVEDRVDFEKAKQLEHLDTDFNGILL